MPDLKLAHPRREPSPLAGGASPAAAVGTQDRGECADVELGRGRSGVVYARRDASGRLVASKVFGSSGITKLVQYLLLGAPNPYLWCKHAVRTAYLRRRILRVLIGYHFGTKLRVAEAYDWRWNADRRAFELDCELITGRPVALRTPFSSATDEQLSDLLDNVMKPLQALLSAAGFDGLVWQAGRGNPVALNNFLCDDDHGDGTRRWVWIDLESGVPALVPINPVDLFCFYLPKSLRLHRPLFDDVDVDALRSHVDAVSASLERKLGPAYILDLHRDVAALADSQRRWKSMPRRTCAIAYHLARGTITRGQAKTYLRQPLRWYAHELCAAVAASVRGLGAGLRAVRDRLVRLDFGKLLKTCVTCLRSQDQRAQLARNYVATRIEHWRLRDQLTNTQSVELKARLEADESGAYLSDFGMHLAVKPVVKSMEWGVVPILCVLGWIDPVTVAVILLSAGAAVRTLYTLSRLFQNAVRGREKPWLALIVGAVPVLGNLAFPFQIILCGSRSDAAVAKFILYDTFAGLGRVFPIWGGRDTHTEHVLNRVPDVLIRRYGDALCDNPPVSPLGKGGPKAAG